MKKTLSILCLILVLLFSISCKKHTKKTESTRLHFSQLVTELDDEKDIQFDYDSPPEQKSRNVIFEGEWKGDYLPIERKSSCDPHFIKKLDSVINSRYVQQDVVKCFDKCFFGIVDHDSSCLLYTIKTDEVEIRWFKSYRHYLTDHNICPSKLFYRVINHLYNYKK